jgi:hypothetical protein
MKRKKKEERDAYLAQEAAEKERKRREREDFEEKEKRDREDRRRREQEEWERQMEERRRRLEEEERLLKEERERRRLQEEEMRNNPTAAFGVQAEQFINLLKQIGVQIPNQPNQNESAEASAPVIAHSRKVSTLNPEWLEARNQAIPAEVDETPDPFQDVETADEVEVRMWLESVLEFTFDRDFFESISDGVVSLKYSKVLCTDVN